MKNRICKYIKKGCRPTALFGGLQLYFQPNIGANDCKFVLHIVFINVKILVK